MALGPSIFLPCNHSGAFTTIYIFACYNKNIKLYLQKSNYCYVIRPFGYDCIIVKRESRLNECAQAVLYQQVENYKK